MAQKGSSGGGGLRALIFLFLAIVAGGAATFLVYNLIQAYQAQIAEAQRPEDTVLAIVAVRELYPGLPITEEDVVGVRFPTRIVHPRAFQSPEHVVGSIPRERILENEVILPDRLADGLAGIGLNALVPEGMRALSINIAHARALSGFLNPGNRVDLVVTITDEKGDRRTATLFQAVPVLAVNTRMLDEISDEDEAAGRRRAPQRRGRPSVTLAVTPEEAVEIAHASRRGSITLTLRSDPDITELDAESITIRQILGLPDEPVAQAPPPRPRPRPVQAEPTGSSLEVYRGTRQENWRVDEDGTAQRGR